MKLNVLGRVKILGVSPGAKGFHQFPRSSRGKIAFSIAQSLEIIQCHDLGPWDSKM